MRFNESFSNLLTMRCNAYIMSCQRIKEERDIMKNILIKSHYGNVVLPKGYCNFCKDYAFIINNELSCCGRRPSSFSKEKSKRECLSESTRSVIPKKIKAQILDQQDNRCVYCNCTLDGYIWHPKRLKQVKIRVHYDHFVPWVYSGDNHKNNIYASCNICNQIKSDKHFKDVISAREYILDERKQKGY